MVAESGAFILVTKDAAAPQFRDDELHEGVEAGRDGREHDVEAIAGIRLQPGLHRVGDLTGRPDHLEPAEATQKLRQLADRQLVSVRKGNETVAAALALIAWRYLG